MPKAMLEKLPDEAKKIYEEVYEKALEQYDGDESKAAATAMEAVKGAGYHKDDESGDWVKRKMEVASMFFTKATVDPDSGEMRWAATVSKFAEDGQGDEVTPDFFKSAIKAVESGVRPLPVLCVSHIDKGKPADSWVAGDTVELYVNDDQPKAKGTFRDTPLGKAVFSAVRDDIKNEVPDEERARISMGFYDESSEPTEAGGRRFKAGWIKHLAVTRVPVVKETAIVVEKGEVELVTVRQDASSIVGEDLARELLERGQAALEKGLVTKANTDQVRALVKQLFELLEEADTDTEEINRDAAGNEGTNPPEAVPAPKATVVPTAVPTEKAGAGVLTEVDAFVNSFAAQVKLALASDGDRTEKFAAIQQSMNEFGEGVTRLVKGTTPPSSQDIGEVVQTAVAAALQPLQQEFLGMKAELARMKDAGGVSIRPVAGAPTAMDNRVVMQTPPILPSGAPAQQPLQRKAKTAAELAWDSTVTPRY